MFLFSILSLDDLNYEEFEKPPCTFNKTFTKEEVQIGEYHKVFSTEGVCIESQIQNLTLVMNEFKGCQIYAEFYKDLNSSTVDHHRLLNDSEDWNSVIDFTGYYGRVWIKPSYTTRIFFKGVVIKSTFRTKDEIFISNMNVNDLYLSADNANSFRTSQYTTDNVFLLFPSAYSKYELSYDLGEGEYIDVIYFGRHQKRFSNKTGSYSFQLVNPDPLGFFIYHSVQNAKSSFLRIRSSIQNKKLIGYDSYDFKPTIPISTFVKYPYEFQTPAFSPGLQALVGISVILIVGLLASCLIMAYVAKVRGPPQTEPDNSELSKIV